MHRIVPVKVFIVISCRLGREDCRSGPDSPHSGGVPQDGARAQKRLFKRARSGFDLALLQCNAWMPNKWATSVPFGQSGHDFLAVRTALGVIWARPLRRE
jgi:hypothetical protein